MPSRFPADFLWGAATAAYQIEGAARADGKGPSIWDVFCATPGRTVNGDTGEIACDHYRLWRQDVELMQRLGLRAYRLSISWPRVIPSGRGSDNPAGWDFYDRLIDALGEAGITPMVTLYHWDLPAALQFELGGWAHHDIANYFADYAERAFRRFAGRVKLWITLNEPWVSVDAGYFAGVHAPGIKDAALGYRAGHNFMRAHACAVERFRALAAPGAIGFAVNTAYSFPATQRPEDIDAAERAMLNWAGWFNDPPYFGDYPGVMRARLGGMMPAFSPADEARLRNSIDFIALNYYHGDVVRHAPGVGPMELERVPQPHIPVTQMGWPIMPDSFERMILWLHRRYGGLPIYITENGAAMDDKPSSDNVVEDNDRIDYLREHIAAVAAARAGGADVRGYFAWSLMDNLEWAAGYSKRFGLVHCDLVTMKRTIKASGRWYARLIEANASELDRPRETEVRST